MHDTTHSSSNDINWGNSLKALEVQARVIHAVMMRETKTRYGEHKLGFLWVLIEPILFIVGFAGMQTMLGTDTINGMKTELFMLTGLAPFLLFKGAMSQASAAITANKPLLAFPQVTTFDLIMARCLLELATVITVFVILLLMLKASGIPIYIQFPMQLLGAFLLFFIIGLGIGAALGCMAPMFPSVREISGQLFGRPLLFTSGTFFSADQLPENVREILLYNPLLQMTELARSAYFVSFESDYVDVHYIVTFSLAVLVFGLLVHQVLHKKVIGL